MTTIDPDATVLLARYWGRHRAPEASAVQVDTTRAWLFEGLRDTVITMVAIVVILMSIDAFL